MLEQWLQECVKKRPSAWGRFALVRLVNRLIIIIGIVLIFAVVIVPFQLYMDWGLFGFTIGAVSGSSVFWLLKNHQNLNRLWCDLEAKEQQLKDEYDCLLECATMIRRSGATALPLPR